MASPFVDTNGRSEYWPKAITSNLCEWWRAARRSSALRCGLHDDSHSIRLNHGNWRLWPNEFPLGDNIYDVIAEARFPARSQNRKGCAQRSGVSGSAVTNSRGTPAREGPGGFDVIRANRR